MKSYYGLFRFVVWASFFLFVHCRVSGKSGKGKSTQFKRKRREKRPAGEVSKQMMNLNEKSLAGFYVAMHREEAAGGR
jgi:hypothetical protein